jgi:hypothetical protein
VEALMERKEADEMSNWNDDRLDELSRRMDMGFIEAKQESKQEFARVNDRLDRFGDRLDRLGDRLDRLMLATFAVMGGTVASLAASLLS